MSDKIPETGVQIDSEPVQAADDAQNSAQNSDSQPIKSGHPEQVHSAIDMPLMPEKIPATEPRGNPALDIKCGPLLRFWGMRDTSPDIWRGSILIVTDDYTSDYQRVPTVSLNITTGDVGTDSITIEAHANRIFQEYKVSFWRFDMDLTMTDKQQAVKYTINKDETHSHVFYIPSLQESMNIMFHSCNGFSLAVDPDKFKGSLWKDVLRKHQERPFHVMLGGGDQLYCDSVKIYTEPVKRWTEEKNPIKKRNMKLSAKDIQKIETYYLWRYINWFGFGHWVGKNGEVTLPDLPKAWAAIPMINIFDDHDIIDGFGSYPSHTMKNQVFNTVGNVAFKYYCLFQLMISPDDSGQNEPSWVLGRQPGPYIHQKSKSLYARLGKSIGFYGLDCRTERKREQICTTSTYGLMFKRLQKEIDASNGELKHILVMLGVPIAYPRLVWLETILSSRLMVPVKKVAHHLFPGLQNEFDGGIEILDDLDDHWCAKHHKSERNQLVASLIDLAKKKSVRITILSGDVHLAGIGRFRASDKSINPTNDPRHILNVISSAIVNTPPPDAMADFLNKRNRVHRFSSDTHEDMVKIFTVGVDKQHRNNQRLLPHRNWCNIYELGSVKSKEIGQPRKPGPQFETNVEPDDDFAYDAAPSSLSVTLNVEIDPVEGDGNTLPYEVFVPVLNMV